jgi:tetratricopeptide (TPR) repeat protein
MIQFYKTIFQGRLDFGSQATYDKVMKMALHRLETYYKNDTIITEEHFKEDEFSLDIPRTVSQITDKFFKNSVDLIEYLAQFAISGKIGCWMVENNIILDYHIVEPSSDKNIVRNFQKGKKLSMLEGKEEEAIKFLSKVIQKHDKHSQAYERRGHVNMILKSWDDAHYDYSKAIRLDPNNAEAMVGRARLHIKQNKVEDAIADLDMATKKSIALQSTYWVARRLKGECHMKLGQFKDAEFDFRLFTKRKFAKEDINYLWRKHILFQYGLVLMELGEYEKAIDSINKSLEIKDGHGTVPMADQLVKRGIAKQKSGSKGFLADWKEAADLGSKIASELLQEN